MFQSKSTHKNQEEIPFKHRRSNRIAKEIEELEYSFSLMLYGSFFGIPALPSFMAMELLPDTEEELNGMLEKSVLLEKKSKNKNPLMVEIGV